MVSERSLLQQRGLNRIVPSAEGIAARDLVSIAPTERQCRDCGLVFTTQWRAKWYCDGCVHAYVEDGPFAHRGTTRDARVDRILDDAGILGRWKTVGTLDTYRAADQPEAYAAALRFLDEWPRQISLGFSGEVGTGKTHLVSGIGRKLALEGSTVKYVHVPTMAWQIKSAESWQKEVTARVGPLFTADLVILDDAGREKDTPAWTEARDAMIDRRWVLQRPTIIATNLTEPHLKEYLGEAAASRFTSEAIVIPMRSGDRRIIPISPDAPF